MNRSGAPSLRESPKQLLNEALSLLPRRTRLHLRAKWFVRGVFSRLPGYGGFVRLHYRFKRQGWAGLFEPPFNITKQDFSAADTRLRWHGWGVLRVSGGYRAQTPTRMALFDTPEAAWQALEAVYWGKPSDLAWEPLGPRNDGTRAPR